MSKPYTAEALSFIFDEDLIWRRKELSDIKLAIKNADATARTALLKAIITMAYAHWEGFVRTCANRYFEHLTLRKISFREFERQIYVNSILVKLDALHQSRVSLDERCKLINGILDGGNGRFSFINPALVDTRSNLNTDVIKDICLICGINSSHFEEHRIFLDIQLLKRRNAIAHGQQEYIQMKDVDDLVGNTLALMESFRDQLENKVYMKTYMAQ